MGARISKPLEGLHPRSGRAVPPRGIAREALTNATRHSGAPRVEVELAFQDGGAVRLAVADDGVGFDVQNVSSDGYGLTSMQDRAARAGVALTFVTEPGAGTEVVAGWSP